MLIIIKFHYSLFYVIWISNAAFRVYVTPVIEKYNHPNTPLVCKLISVTRAYLFSYIRDMHLKESVVIQPPRCVVYILVLNDTCIVSCNSYTGEATIVIEAFNIVLTGNDSLMAAYMALLES